MSDTEGTIFHNHNEDSEELLHPSVILPTETFEEVLQEMENKISHLEDFLAKLEEDFHPSIEDVVREPTLTEKVRDWVTQAENMPSFIKPFITAEEPVSDQRRTYKTFDISMHNSKRELNSMYANVVAENFIFGAAGGVGIGFAVNSLMPMKSRLKNISSMRESSFRKGVAYMGIAQGLAKKAVIAGFLYDFIKRNMEQNTGNRHWSNSVCSAALCGAMYGLKSGLPKCILSAAGLAVSAFIWEECPTLHSVT